MNNIDYIILDIGKIVIKRDGTKKIFYKEYNHELLELSDEEKKVIDNIFDSDKYRENYYSIILDNIIANNFKLEEKEYFKNFLDYIEKIIPDNCKDNFYKNLETLETQLNFHFNFDDINIEENEDYSACANYNTKNNKLIMSKASLKRIWEISKKASNPNEFFWKEINCTVLHELLHMASSKYDKESGISFCGFDIYPTENDENKNRGLTEGMTDVIAFSGIPGTAELSSGYYIECLLVNQLFQIVGVQVMIESYFGNKGVGEIKKKLNDLIPNKDMATILFMRIEDNFYLRNVDCKQIILTNIQSTLIAYFRAKLLNDLNNNIDSNIILNSLAIYQQMLVTDDILINLEKNPNNYLFLNNSIQEFYELKNEILALLSKKITIEDDENNRIKK